jgi:MoaA/NifB/PqqE/SkfB family radical SAM enzyme
MNNFASGKIDDSTTRVGSETMFDNKVFMVNFSLGNQCNYRCSYCWPILYANTTPFQNFNFYNLFIDDLKEQVIEKNFEHLTILFTGGEPTTYKFLGKVVKNFTEKHDKLTNNIVINTNLSPSLSYWKRMRDLGKDAGYFHLCASLHHEYVEAKEFAKKCKEVKALGYGLTVREVVRPDNVDKMIELHKAFEDEGIFFELKPLLLGNDKNMRGKQTVEGFSNEDFDRLIALHVNSKYRHEIWPYKMRVENDQESIDIISEFRLFYNRDTGFKGWNCSAGMNHISVAGDGEVKRCHDHRNLDTLGNIFDGQRIKLYDHPKICPVGYCGTITGLQATKTRIKNA